MMHATATRKAAPDGGGSGYVRLQRRCACGAGAKDEQCESCKAKGAGVQAKLTVGATDDPFEREADAMAARVMSGAPGSSSPAPLAVQRVSSSSSGEQETAAPPQVEQVIASSGQPLDASTRAFFEPRFGHDFGAVRIHRDAAAADSARRVSARAYTAGEHVVFGSGQYAPGSAAGRALLAHELTHVLQQRPQVQRAVVQRDSIGVEPEGVSGERQKDTQDDDERKRQAATVTSGAVQRSPLRLQREGLDDDPLRSSWPEKDEADAIRADDKAARECLAAAPKDKVECDPDRALTWADFTGTPDGSTFGAMTFSGLREREINIADRRCKPAWAPANQPSRGVQAFFTPSRSWVRPKFANAGDPVGNGCNATVAACHADFAAGNSGFHLSPAVPARGSPGCPAGVAPAGTPATKDGECDTIVGVDCNTTKMAESMRLLNHEQWHFSLSCAMAQKANAMLATTPDFDALLRAAQAELSRQQSKYDGETVHGCNGGSQSSWQADIAAGLQSVTIAVPAPAAPRRRR